MYICTSSPSKGSLFESTLFECANICFALFFQFHFFLESLLWPTWQLPGHFTYKTFHCDWCKLETQFFFNDCVVKLLVVQMHVLLSLILLLLQLCVMRACVQKFDFSSWIKNLSFRTLKQPSLAWRPLEMVYIDRPQQSSFCVFLFCFRLLVPSHCAWSL